MKKVEIPEFDSESDDSICLYSETVFRQEMRELLRGEVSYLEGDNKEKARRVLACGTRQILQGKTSSAFMLYVAICLSRHLEKNVSLDVVFGREQGQGRPKDDPAKFDHVVAAFYDAADDDTLHTPEERQQRGFKAAFQAHHGKTEEELKYLGMSEEEFKRSGRTGIDPKSIDNMKVATRKILQDRGLYFKKGKTRT